MTEPTAEELYTLYCQPGASLRSIAQQVGKSHGWVSKRLRDAGYSLKPVGSPDMQSTENEPLSVVTGRVEPALKEWLRSLPEGESYHIRQALILYKKSLE